MSHKRELAVVCGLLFAPSLVWAVELPLAQVLERALRQNPEIRVQQSQIDIAKAQHQQAVGQFDWMLNSKLDYSRTVTPQAPSATIAQNIAYESGYQIGINRQLRNGIQVTGELKASANVADSNTGKPQQNSSKVELSLIFPLLKGRGTDVNTAAETSAKLVVLKSRYDLRDKAAQTLYATLLAYWDYRTRAALYAVAQDSEKRSKDLLDSNQKLVDAAEKPRADLVLLKADLADKAAATQAASLAQSEARKTLGRLLGLDLSAIQQLPPASDNFPAVSKLMSVLPSAMPAWQQLATQQRSDLRALSLQLEATQRQFVAAQNKQKPQLDLNLGVGYGRASEGGSRYGFVREAGRNTAEPSVFAHLSYQFPVENNQAKGVAQEFAAQLAQLETRQRDLADSIISGVDSAAQALQRSAVQIHIAEQALALYEQAVRQEIIKQKNGIATLIDVINVEARFVNARVNLLQLQQTYANALARLRFETGSFFVTPELAAGANEDSNEQMRVDLREVADLGPLANYVRLEVQKEGQKQ